MPWSCNLYVPIQSNCTEIETSYKILTIDMKFIRFNIRIKPESDSYFMIKFIKLVRFNEWTVISRIICSTFRYEM